MVVSMTGFGRSKVVSGPFSVNVEIKTVNHRFSEYSIRMPRQLLKIEEKMKKKLNQHIRRGRVEVYVTLEGEGTVTRKVQVDWKLIEEYYQFIQSVKERYSIEGSISLNDILGREELVHIEESEFGNEELENAVIRALEEAVILLKQMRLAEGVELKKDITANLYQLESSVIELRRYAPLVVQGYKERLTKRMTEFLNGQYDEARILTEVAIFADKADINEEMTRLCSHVQQFLQTLEDQEPIGRKLDFLVQEMNREVNTIGSKANDSNIAKMVVEMKSLLEKLKEQIQNIE
ncbi:MAG: YicC/YloC family endoribonuclease [Bacillota bacterium]|nr:YicC/YloC family endoribonuclease [Bacillota bacterium]